MSNKRKLAKNKRFISDYFKGFFYDLCSIMSWKFIYIREELMEKYFDINEKGHSIRCKLFCNNARDINEVVLCAHGFAGHKDNKSTERFANDVLSKFKKTAVLIFDLPAHGKDVKKRVMLSDCDEYISIILDYIRTQCGTDNIKGYANSFGGYLFLKYIHDHGNPFVRLALRSPAITIYESVLANMLAEGDMDLLEKGKDALIGFDRKIAVSKDFIEDIRRTDVRKYDYLDEIEKIIIIQGTGDEIIDCNEVYEFADNNLIEYVPVEGADHRISKTSDMGNVIKRVIEFLEL